MVTIPLSKRAGYTTFVRSCPRDQHSFAQKLWNFNSLWGSLPQVEQLKICPEVTLLPKYIEIGQLNFHTKKYSSKYAVHCLILQNANAISTKKITWETEDFPSFKLRTQLWPLFGCNSLNCKPEVYKTWKYLVPNFQFVSYEKFVS